MLGFDLMLVDKHLQTLLAVFLVSHGCSFDLPAAAAFVGTVEKDQLENWCLISWC